MLSSGNRLLLVVERTWRRLNGTEGRVEERNREVCELLDSGDCVVCGYVQRYITMYLVC
jgi:hypothetical protein